MAGCDRAAGRRVQFCADDGPVRLLLPGLDAAFGIVAAVIIRQLLAVAGIGDYVVAPLLTYAALAVSATLLAWLLWFGH